MKYTAIVVTLLLTGIGAAWAECPEGKSEVVLYTPSGKANMLCVSDNALPGIANANEHTTLDVCEEVTCPCWDAETLENLPDITPEPDGIACFDDYMTLNFVATYTQAFGPHLLVWDDYANHSHGLMACALRPRDNVAWGATVEVVNLSHAESSTCAEILRASKWWAMCSEVQH